MKKLELKLKSIKLGIKNKEIVVIVISALIVGAIAGGVVWSKNEYKSKDVLTDKLGIKEAVKTKEETKSPYNITKESFQKAINNDSFIHDNFNLTESYTDSINSVDNTDCYNSSRVYSMSGINKEDSKKITKEEALTKARNISALLITHNNFNKPTSVAINYTVGSDEEVKKAEESSRNVIGKLFNKDIAAQLYVSEDSDYSIEVPSKSGDYTCKISRSSQANDATKLKVLMVSVDYSYTNIDNFDLAKYVINDENKPLYMQLNGIKDISLKDVAKKYSDIVGEHKDTGLLNFMNSTDTISEIGDKTYVSRASSLEIATVYKDDMQTAMNLRVQLISKDKTTAPIAGAFSLKTATKYFDDVTISMQSAIRSINKLLGIKLEPTVDNFKEGKYNVNVTESLFGFKFNLDVDIKTTTDENGTYATVTIKDKNSIELEEGNQ